jgi:hypothetical protein
VLGEGAGTAGELDDAGPLRTPDAQGVSADGLQAAEILAPDVAQLAPGRTQVAGVQVAREPSDDPTALVDSRLGYATDEVPAAPLFDLAPPDARGAQIAMAPVRSPAQQSTSSVQVAAAHLAASSTSPSIDERAIAILPALLLGLITAMSVRQLGSKRRRQAPRSTPANPR